MANPISERKLEANRANAKKSTGPKTDKGKRIASLNSVTHGVFAKSIIPDGPPLIEDKKVYVTLLEGLRTHWEPVGVYEDTLVQEIANAKWKALRLERYEAAGLSERLSAAIANGRNRVEEERWSIIHNGMKLHGSGDPGERPYITAKMLQDQVDLVARLEVDEAEIDNEPTFLAFVSVEKGNNEDDDANPEMVAEEQGRKLLATLSPAELDNLRDRYCSNMEVVLQSMWDLRAKAVPLEVSIERSLVPDEAEMSRIIRASSHVTRLEERKVEMLERLQEARRRKEGRNR